MLLRSSKPKLCHLVDDEFLFDVNNNGELCERYAVAFYGYIFDNAHPF